MTRRADISRGHVIQAIRDLEKGASSNYGRPMKYEVLFEGKRYSPKAVLARAIYHCSGVEPALKSFSGGESTNSVLRSLGFEISTKLSTSNPSTK